MLRKILSFFFALFMFLPTARGAEMVNVEYIHQYLNARWGIELPYNPELKNPKVAANMEYLLTVVDIANEYLNGEKTTSYGTGEYATKLAADTIATNKAIDTLVRGPGFYITTTPDTTEFHIIIGAAGDFVIDWGDREYETISDKQLGKTVYSHTYASPGEYLVRLSGTATDYYNNAGSSNLVADIAFYDSSYRTNSQHIAKISGSLGDVFPTLPDGTNPTFYMTFMDAKNLTEIPANLFGELNGDGAPSMFASTFSHCNLTRLNGPLFSGTLAPAKNMFSSTFFNTPITSIPENLFGELNGDGATGMFSQTFSGCRQLQTIEGPLFSGTITPAPSMFYITFYASGLTSIPADLFAGVRGAPAARTFSGTFRDTQITSIPENLFAGISGAPAESMFGGTFYNSKLTSIPENLFAGISGAPAVDMFGFTFKNCTSLTGPSARTNGQYLYEIWPDATSQGTYSGATGLSDYDQIPDNWK